MKTNRYLVAVLVLSLAAAGIALTAQTKGLSKEAGEVGLGLALRHLTNTGIFLYTGAHPDDENNGLLVMLQRGLGYRTAVFTCTRGSGGQNEIGPELFESLAVLRTEELAGVHAFDGSEQYFGREIDFGFSFSIEETFEKWGRDRVTSDYVRIMRMVRPDVIVTMRPDGEGGGQHHQAQARITGEAFRLAADPAKFPEQLREGLRPWQPRKFYYTERYGFRGEPQAGAARLLEVSNDVFDPLLGQTYSEIGGEARSNHKCQGMAQLLPLPGAQSMGYRLGDSALPGGPPAADRALFDGIDTTLPGLARLVNGEAPDALKNGLSAIAREAEVAQRAFASSGPAATLPPLAAGLAAVRALRGQLAALLPQDDQGRFEIDFRLAAKQDEFEKALVQAQGIRIDVLADDGLVFAGQPVRTTTIIANRGEGPVRVARVALAGFDGESACKTGDLGKMGVYRCDSNLRVPADTRLSTPYWRPIPGTAQYEFDADAPFGAPFRPTPFRARIDLVIGGVDVPVDAPVVYRYEGTIFTGEKRMELLVVPRYSVSLTPDIAIVPSAAVKAAAASKAPAPVSPAAPGAPVVSRRSPGEGGSDRELRVTVVNGNKGAARAEASLQVPAGWTVRPATASVEFSREDESDTVRFTVTPSPTAVAGEYRVRAVVRADGQSFDQGYEVIEYPHIHRRHRVLPAETSIKVIDVKVAPGLQVGYVMGVGDQVPPAIEQLGVQLDLLGADDLAWGDLSKYDAIVTGVRAYERRADLRANNHRLLDYVGGGGTLIVQYNKMEFNEAQYGPYPAKVSSNRVTDENAPVAVLVPGDPVFGFPNRIGDATWKGWVQERGLYFLGDDKDPRYVDLVQTQDPFPYNKGIKKGAIVEATVGKGRWIYVGLGLWRQLPAGTDGAYQLLANLISVGRAPAPKAGGTR
jgi:LmbE family N-acetylglucosaminyl deacetylase